jgi:hypothetical protein
VLEDLERSSIGSLGKRVNSVSLIGGFVSSVVLLEGSSDAIVQTFSKKKTSKVQVRRRVQKCCQEVEVVLVAVELLMSKDDCEQR